MISYKMSFVIPVTSTEAPFHRLYSESQINEALLQEESENFKVDCEVSAWSAWSRCNVLENCGRGYKTKHRFIKVTVLDLKVQSVQHINLSAYILQSIKFLKRKSSFLFSNLGFAMLFL